MVFQIIFAAISGFLAHKRGRNPYIWVVIGFFLLVFAPLLLLILPDLTEAKEQAKQPAPVKEDGPEVIDITPKEPPSGGFEEKEWFYAAADRKQIGPVDLEALRAAFKAGTLNADTYVWCEGMDDWKRLRDYPELGKVIAVN